MNKRAAEIAALLQSTRFDPLAPEPPDQCIFYMQWKRILNLGDYMLFTGKKGTGKTKIVSAAIAAAITRDIVFNLQIKLPDNKRFVMHLDTEQGRTSHYRMMTLVKKLAKIENLPFFFSSHRLRGIRPRLIQDMIEYYLETNPECGMIFLDGMLDVVDNMNDVTESKRLKEWMEGISEKHNVAIAGVMHRGFTADKAIGHSGSFLERGAQTVLKIEKEKRDGLELYIISTEHIREDGPPEDTAFYYNKQTNDWELFQLVPAEMEVGSGINRKTIQKRPGDFDIQEHSRRCGQIFDCSTYLSYELLIKEICQAYGVGTNIAKSDYYPFLINRFFWKTENGYTHQQQGKLLLQPAKDNGNDVKLFIQQ